VAKLNLRWFAYSKTLNIIKPVTRVPAALMSGVWSESYNPVRRVGMGRTHGGIKAREVHTEGERFVPFGEAFREVLPTEGLTSLSNRFRS